MGGKLSKDRRPVLMITWGACALLLLAACSGLFGGIGRAWAANGHLLQGEEAPLGEGTSQEEEDPQEADGANLPDLQTLLPTDLQIDYDDQSGRRLLRFTSLFTNTGQGPLELKGEYDQQSGEIQVFQHMDMGGDRAVEELDGAFYYDTEHNHYHWENFALYEVWTVETSGVLSRAVVTLDKVGFCLVDTRRVGSEWLEQNDKEGLEIARRAEYLRCGVNRQGISVGWVDVYKYDLPGQAMDIEDLDDGVYALRLTVDPDRVLYEGDPQNNSAVLYFVVQGEEVHEMEAFSLSAVCDILCAEEEKTAEAAAN